MPPLRGPSRVAAALALLLTATLVAAAVLCMAPLRARADWTRTGGLPGLGSGRIWTLAIDPLTPATVLAGTDAGIYRSSDAGATWTLTSVAGIRVWSLVIEAVGTTHLAFAGTDGHGIERSDDAGTTWADASSGLPSSSVRSLASGDGLTVAGTADGVAVSTDGRQWQPLGLRGYDITSLVVSSDAPQPAVIAAADTLPNTVVPSATPSQDPGSPAGSAAASGATPGSPLFRTIGPSATWTPIALGPPGTVVSSLAAGPVPATTLQRPLVAASNNGVYQSGDGGTNWTRTYPPKTLDDQTQTLTTVVFSPLDPQLVYGGNDAGGSSGGSLLRSTNGGTSFDAADTGLPTDAHNVVALAVAPSSPPRVLAAIGAPGVTAGVFSQTDATAPPPAATAPPPAGTVVPTIGALPVSTPVPPIVIAPPPPSSPAPAWRRAFNWPFPLAVELFLLAGLVWLGLVWRQRRLDIEGPP